jgi:hypothetical protein
MSTHVSKRTLPQFTRAPLGVLDHWATIHVRLHSPIHDVDDPTGIPTQGYYRVFGLRAAPNRVRELLTSAVPDGAIDWSDSECRVVDPETLDQTIQRQIRPVVVEGIWYRSGHVFYADSDLDSSDN